MLLLELPAELLALIIRRLDPVALISASQTVRQLRKLISPKKKHFVERLLSLECLRQHGGLTPIYNPMRHAISPPWGSSEWVDMRWTCTDCVRLLTHTSFDNHSLIGLHYRKPPRQSSTACTSWEPTRREEYRTSRHISEQDEQKCKNQYSLIGSMNWSEQLCRPRPALFHTLQIFDMSPFAAMTSSDFAQLEEDRLVGLLEQMFQDIECLYGGRKRNLRRCLECRYRNGLIKPGQTYYGGTIKVPVAHSRLLRFPTELERWFPHFWNVLESKRPQANAPVFRIHRTGAYDMTWAMHMVRCPRCTRWQEIREFRNVGLYPHWRPQVDSPYDADGDNPEYGYLEWEPEQCTKDAFDALICNHCYAEEHGKRRLSTVLMKGLNTIIYWRRRSFVGFLTVGWHELWRLMRYLPSTQKPWKRKVRHLLKDVIPQLQRPDRSRAPGPSAMALLELRFNQWQTLWDEIEGEAREEMFTERQINSLESWMNEYYVVEAHLDWLHAVDEELKEKPDAMADWALSRDGASLT